MPAWTKTEIAKTRQRIRQRLESSEQNGGKAARSQTIKEELERLEPKLEPPALLERYTYLMSALVLQERWSHMSAVQIKRLAETAEAVLDIAGIDRARSAFAYLYGEVHLILSQIYRKSGAHWRALWHQQISLGFSHHAPTNGPGLQLISTGIRAIRLGQGQLAIDAFVQAETYDLSDKQRQRARIGHLNALRIAGRIEEAATLVSRSIEEMKLSDAGQIEIEWELACIEYRLSRDPSVFYTKLRRGKDHHQSSYMLEGFLWIHAHAESRHRDQLIKVSTVGRSRQLRAHREGQFYEACLTLENCYDVQIPFHRRFLKLGDVLNQVDQLITIDKQMLVLCAAARWLYRNRQYLTAEICLNEYRGLSWKLSNGQNADVLGLVGDMIEGTSNKGRWKRRA